MYRINGCFDGPAESTENWFIACLGALSKERNSASLEEMLRRADACRQFISSTIKYSLILPSKAKIKLDHMQSQFKNQKFTQ